MTALRSNKGQSLIELIVAVGIGVLFIVAALGIITLSLRIDFDNKFSQSGNELVQEVIDQVTVFANANWHNIDGAVKSTEETPIYYHLTITGGFYTLTAGLSTVSIDSVDYEVGFYVEEVSRDETNAIVDTGGTMDPSTLKINASVSWTDQGQPRSFLVSKYLSRIRNREFIQTDWSGGPWQEGPITSPNTAFATSSGADYSTQPGSIFISSLSTSTAPSSQTNIDPVDKWAWNDIFGWSDFRETMTVLVSSTVITGYASSGIGHLAFDCATTPSGDVCSTSDFKVINDGNGNLSGWAWNDTIGWVSFSGTNYGVSISPTTGEFSGWAWNDVVGWLGFNCEDSDICSTSDFRVKTYWGTPPLQATLESTTFETPRAQGAAYNTLMWQGVLPLGTNVKFQLCTSNTLSGSPWVCFGPDGSELTYYQPTGPDDQVTIAKINHNNHRYVRYKVFLESDSAHSSSPQVNDIIINWSL